MRPVAKPVSEQVKASLSESDERKLRDDELRKPDLSLDSFSVWPPHGPEFQNCGTNRQCGRERVEAYVKKRELPGHNDILGNESVASWCANNGLFENFIWVATSRQVRAVDVRTALGVETVCRALPRCPDIRSLLMHSAAVSEVALTSLIENDTLTCLSLENCTLIPSAAEVAAIQRACGPQKRLEGLACRAAKGAGQSAFRPLIDILSRSPALTTLIVDVGHDADSVRSLITALEQHASVRGLSFENAQSISAIESLLAALAPEKSALKLLSVYVDLDGKLENKSAGDSAVKLASDLIRRCSSLQSLGLILSDNRLYGSLAADDLMLEAWRDSRSFLDLLHWQCSLSRTQQQVKLGERLARRNRAFWRAERGGIAHAVAASFPVLNQDVAALIAQDLRGNKTPAELKAAQGIMAVNRASAASAAIPASVEKDLYELLSLIRFRR